MSCKQLTCWFVTFYNADKKSQLDLLAYYMNTDKSYTIYLLRSSLIFTVKNNEIAEYVCVCVCVGLAVMRGH